MPTEVTATSSSRLRRPQKHRCISFHPTSKRANFPAIFFGANRWPNAKNTSENFGHASIATPKTRPDATAAVITQNRLSLCG